MTRQWTLRRRLVLALTFASLTLAAAGWAQQKPAAGQAPAAGGGRGNFGANFTGKVVVADSTDMRTSRIRFEAGARTNWHLHSTGQLLLVEDGKGRLQEEGGAIVELMAGKPVYTKPNVRHWHGAAPDMHALQFSVYSGTLAWQEAVTDEVYAGKK
jgi:quercetin dioxygenase-like cupin family protein